MIAFILPASAAHAGVASLLQKVFGDNQEVVFDREEFNSQNVALLQAAVNADPNPPAGGGNITVVGGSALLSQVGPSGSLADVSEEADAPRSNQVSVYVVREGDSLSQIADMFGVSVNTIRWANDIGSDGVIHEGQALVILPVTGVQYTVEKGDTLGDIAEKFDSKVDEIREFNGIADDGTLAVGDELVIPHGEMPQRVQKQYGGGNYAVQNSSTPSYSGYYGRPVRVGVRTQGLHGFNAVDFGASYGAPVVASAGGRVVASRYRAGNPWFGGYGNYIVIEHDNGTQTLYAHLSDNIVKRGWKVVKGQVIGYVGSTGRSTGPHVHFEVRGAKNPF